MDLRFVGAMPEVFAWVDFAGGPTGYLLVASVADGSAAYEYMPLRNGPHYKLARAMLEQGQAEVSIRLAGGPIIMIATALSSRSITLAATASA